MTAPSLSISRRIRSTPFSRRVEAAGVKAYTVYNRMLLPTVFFSVEDDYHHLKRAVQVWDVSCERQVELAGPDAAKLAQLMTPRDLGRLQDDQCVYTPAVDEQGGMLNDPMTMRIGPDRYWVSIADSDLLFWAKGLALGRGLDVSVSEPDVSPLAVQGPKADDLMARVFGDGVRGIRFFRFLRLPFRGREFIVARSGYCKQGGFEIYVEGDDLAEPLWDALFTAGKDLDVRPGCPNLIERIEGGLLSYGNDMTLENNPYECGLGRFCKPSVAVDCVGRDALLQLETIGPAREMRSFAIDGDAQPPCTGVWRLWAQGQQVGTVTSAAWSPDFETTVALGIINASHWADGTTVEVETPDGMRTARVHERPFI